MKNESPRRPLFQIHLSTLVFLSMASGLLLSAGWFGWREFASGGQLLAAVRANETRSVLSLLKWGAKVNGKDHINCTPLHYVRDPKIAEVLILNGADPNAKSDDGFTPLHYVPSTKSVELAKTLLEGGGRLDIKDKDGQTPLDYAMNLDAKEIAALFRNHKSKGTQEPLTKK